MKREFRLLAAIQGLQEIAALPARARSFRSAYELSEWARDTVARRAVREPLLDAS